MRNSLRERILLTYEKHQTENSPSIEEVAKILHDKMQKERRIEHDSILQPFRETGHESR